MHTTRSAAALLATMALAGCAAPLTPVADFGRAASSLATDYRPFVSGLADTCEQRAGYRALSVQGSYDLVSARREASKQCAPLREATHTAGLVADALGDYAAALGRLAGVKDTALDGPLRDVSGSLEALPGRDGDPLFSHDTVSAATKLARAAAALAVQQRTHALAREALVDHHAELVTVVASMKTFVTAVYAGELASTRELMKGEYARLVAASHAATQGDVQVHLPYRWAQASALAELEANEAAQRRAAAFGRAADALVAAHAALIDRFDTLDGQARVAAVSDLLDRVRALRDDAAAI